MRCTAKTVCSALAVSALLIVVVRVQAADDSLETNVPEHVALADDPQAFLSALRFIKEQHLKANAALKSVYLRGRILPGDMPVVCAIKDGKYRCDRQYKIDGQIFDSYRLFDGTTDFRVGNGAIEACLLNQPSLKWRSTIAGNVFDFTMVEVQGWQSFDELCSEILELFEAAQIPEGVSPEVSTWLALDRNESTIRFSCRVADKFAGTDGLRFTVTIDAAQGYQVTASHGFSQSTEDPENTFHEEIERHCKYRELEPGVFVPVKGTRRVLCSGKVAERQNSAGQHARALIIEEVKTGDSEIPDELFSVESLPIKVGMNIHDSRFHKIAKVYPYDVEPLAECLLKAANAVDEDTKDVAEPCGSGQAE